MMSGSMSFQPLFGTANPRSPSGSVLLNARAQGLAQAFDFDAEGGVSFVDAGEIIFLAHHFQTPGGLPGAGRGQRAGGGAERMGGLAKGLGVAALHRVGDARQQAA